MSALSQVMDRIRRHKAAAGLGAFLSWWREQLLEGLPASWREKLHTRRARLLVRFDDSEVVLDLEGDGEASRFARDEEAAIASQTVSATLTRLDEDDPDFVFVVPKRQALVRTLTLPAATEENLGSVLRFEMDRHTPFKPEQVYFDAQIIDRVAGGGKIRVALTLVRRNVVDEIAQFARSRGMALHAVDVVSESGARSGVNLLPEAMRARHDRRQVRWNVALAVLFCALLYTVLWQSVAMREDALTGYQERLGEVRAEAADVIALREELIEARDAASFLGRRKVETPSMINLLAELTGLLPNDTWLQRLQITGDSLQISGQTPETARLVGLIETDSRMVCDPNIRGAVTPDQASGKERFTIEGALCAPAEEPELDAGSEAATAGKQSGAPMGGKT